MNEKYCNSNEHDWPVSQFTPDAIKVSGLCWKCGIDASQLQSQREQEVRRACDLSSRLVKPYYERDGIMIFHGDCREVLPLLRGLERFELMLTDPPYGISYSPSGGGRGAFGKPVFKKFTGKDVVAGDDEPFDPSPLLGHAKNHILWGANHYASRLPDQDNWLVWDKREAESTLKFADCEMAWTDLPGQARIFRHMWNGVAKASEVGESRLHPTQKPVALMRWCIRQAGNPRCVLDPYMGSGTTLLAAKDAGCTAIGIEIREDYCEIAAKRLAQGVLAL